MIHLARHGQTAYNAEGRFQGHLPVPLDDTGREQARKLAEMFRKNFEKFGAVPDPVKGAGPRG